MLLSSEAGYISRNSYALEVPQRTLEMRMKEGGLTPGELSGRCRMKRQRRWQMGAKEEVTSVNGRGPDLLSAVTSGQAPAPYRR